MYKVNKVLFVLLLSWSAVSAGEWTHWRGPDQDGSSAETNLPASWSQDGDNLLWSAPYGARIAPLVMDGQVYLINRAGESGDELQERVMALDFDTGKVVWEHRFNVFHCDIVAQRLGWAQLAGDPETGNIYAHGVQGLFMCFDKKGKILWEHSLTEEFGRISGYGGRTNSPIVEGDMVIISSMTSGWGPHAKPVHRFFAMDKNTGEVLWISSPSGRPLDTTYSVPVIGTLDGVRTLFAGLADGSVWALKAHTGEPIWSFDLSKRGLNVSVLYQNGKVYAGHSEENFDTSDMGRFVCINARGEGNITKTGEVWRVNIGNGYSSPAYHDGLIYVSDNSANLYCIDAETGKVHWEFNYGTAAKGSPLYADGKIYVGEEGGAYHILEVSKTGCKRLSQQSFTKADGSPIEIHGTPVAVDGRVLLPTRESIYCIGLGNGKSKTAAKQMAGEHMKSAVGAAATLVVQPAESWIQEGSQQKFLAKTYDAKGNYVATVTAEWSIKGAKGSFDGNTFKASATDRVHAAVVAATAGNLSGTARLRVLPDLPYHEDFESFEEGPPPPGWITSAAKSQITTMDGSKVLRKLANRAHPAFARMRNYMLPPMEAGYTVQADLNGQSKKRRFWPDMGLINSRYSMILMGTTRKPALRLVTYDPIPRLQKDIEFDWKPDTWYTMKMSYSIKDGKGWVRGKVWPRGEAEPEAWTIEVTDPLPNTGGSPALYGYSTAITETSTGTEVFYDNVSITRN